MRFRLPLAVAVVISALALSPLPRMLAFPAPSADTATIYATITGDNGRPIRGLSAGDFVVQENGATKEVVKAEPATEPLTVELMTDRLGSSMVFAPDQMRAAMGAVVHTILDVIPDSQIGLVTFDGQSIQQVKFTSSRDVLDGAIKKMFSNNSSPVLLEAIADACNAFKLEHKRRDIVAIVGTYKGDASAVTPRAAAEALRSSGAALWMLQASGAGATAISSGNVDAMATMATRDSGGLATSVNTGTALEGAATKLAVMMLAQYAITYGAPLHQNDVRLDVNVKAEGAHIFAPHWTSGR